jgi:hypothetical protein
VCRLKKAQTYISSSYPYLVYWCGCVCNYVRLSFWYKLSLICSHYPLNFCIPQLGHTPTLVYISDGYMCTCVFYLSLTPSSLFSATLPFMVAFAFNINEFSFYRLHTAHVIQLKSLHFRINLLNYESFLCCEHPVNFSEKLCANTTKELLIRFTKMNEKKHITRKFDGV